MNKKLWTYVESIQNTEPTIPSIMDENTFFECINAVYNESIFSFAELTERYIFNISLYGIEDGKKELSIEMIRRSIRDLSLKPYEWKHLFVFQDFDTAGIPAQNAMLKMLEDFPEYAVIILIVKNPKRILPTIESRIISFFQNETPYLNAEIAELLREFFSGNIDSWMSYLYKNNFSKEEAHLILTTVFSRLNFEEQNFCKKMILALENGNESPKNILENFFLTGDFFK